MFNQQHSLELKNCLACGSPNLTETLDLGMQPLANSYKTRPEQFDVFFPLAINRCTSCYHVQLSQAVNPELMFSNYLYVSGTSQTMHDHFKWFADYASEFYIVLNYSKPETVFDIGCNDGSQLDYFRHLSMKTYGIDPAKNLYVKSAVKGHNIDLRFFDEKYVLDTDRTYDILVAQNVFAHNYDPLTFMKCARKVMHEKSIFFVQTSQADMILNNEFDTIYHEHISFYNINSMNKLAQRAGMHMIDVIKCPLHGNSYIFVFGRDDTFARPSHIQNLIQMEKNLGLLNDDTYVQYQKRCLDVIYDLKHTINEKQGAYKIVGYGAAAKGMTLINATKIPMDYIIDDNSLKQGMFTPGRNIEICSIDRLDNESGNIFFVPLAWNFFDEIRQRIKKKRNNPSDQFCKYFPTVEIFS